MSVTIHELENRLKDMQFQKEQFQHEMKVLQQQCHQNMFGDQLKKLVKVKWLRIIAPSKRNQIMLFLFKKEKLRRICTTCGKIGHF